LASATAHDEKIRSVPNPENITPERKAKLEKVLRQRQSSLTVIFENVHDPH